MAKFLNAIAGEQNHPGRLPQPHREAGGEGGQEGKLYQHVPMQSKSLLLC